MPSNIVHRADNALHCQLSNSEESESLKDYFEYFDCFDLSMLEYSAKPSRPAWHSQQSFYSLKSYNSPPWTASHLEPRTFLWREICLVTSWYLGIFCVLKNISFIIIPASFVSWFSFFIYFVELQLHIAHRSLLRFLKILST